MFVKGLKAPCQGCTPETGRQVVPVNCHTYCEKYLDFCKKNANNKQIKKEMKKPDEDYYAVRSAGFKKTAR